MDTAKRGYEVYPLFDGFSRIPFGIIKVGNLMSDYIALGGTLILSNPEIVSNEMLKDISKDLSMQEIETRKKVENLLLVGEG